MSRKQTLTAIIYDRRGRVLSIGQNSYIKTHPLQKKHAQRVGLDDKIFLHAEIHAIAKCRDIDRAYRILISRWNKDGESALAKPCAICQSAIEAAGIKVVEYTL